MQKTIFGVPGPAFLRVMKQPVRKRGKGFAPTAIWSIVLERIIMVLKMKKYSVLMKNVMVALLYLSLLIFFKFSLKILQTLVKMFRNFSIDAMTLKISRNLVFGYYWLIIVVSDFRCLNINYYWLLFLFFFQSSYRWLFAFKWKIWKLLICLLSENSVFLCISLCALSFYTGNLLVIHPPRYGFFIDLAPTDGHWGRWSSWSTCDVTCGEGTKKRSRKCNDPPAKNGGRHCKGPAEFESRCLMANCSLGNGKNSFKGSFNCI